MCKQEYWSQSWPKPRSSRYATQYPHSKFRLAALCGSDNIKFVLSAEQFAATIAGFSAIRSVGL